MEQHAAPRTPNPAHGEPFTERLVPLAEICARTNLERTTIHRLVQRGDFPKLRRKGNRRVFVLESELLAWMRA